MIKYFPILFFLALSIRGSGQVVSQGKSSLNANENKTADIQLVTQQSRFLNDLYYQKITVPKEIINGKEYLPYFYRSKTTPLLFSGQSFNATLYLNNRRYENIKLQYDTYLDEIIYTDTSRMLNFTFPMIALNKDIVDGFSICPNGDSLIFKHLLFTGKPGEKLADGFYQIVHDGLTKCLIKHRSTIFEKEAVNAYHYSPETYILLENKYFKVTNKKNFILMFGELAPKIKKYINESGIRIRKTGNKQIAEVLKYYESLVNSE
jgi:hypothetical protein